MQRRLPVYLVLDVSGSMCGSAIEAVRMGLKQLRTDLQSDPNALESVWFSVITFSNEAKQVTPLTEIGAFEDPVLNTAGNTSLGAGLKLLMQCIDKEVRKSSESEKGDWKPLVFLLTDGQPSDSWEKAAEELKARRYNIVACAAGPSADVEMLKKITESVVKLSDVSSGTLGAFMAWMSASVSGASTTGDAPLPTLPSDNNINIVA